MIQEEPNKVLNYQVLKDIGIFMSFKKLLVQVLNLDLQLRYFSSWEAHFWWGAIRVPSPALDLKESCTQFSHFRIKHSATKHLFCLFRDFLLYEWTPLQELSTLMTQQEHQVLNIKRSLSFESLFYFFFSTNFPQPSAY